ncbi:MAG: hypothetical protein HPY76_00280 [Anaerolineae bacterium]|jgi:hypothetical protein|nr:hypothetical protein [Anaerolineae bacterium]
MGIKYSFLLYFERQHLWDALQGIAAFAQPGKLPTLIAFPDHLLSLPFEGFITERIIPADSDDISFMTSLYFAPDKHVSTYLEHLFRLNKTPEPTTLPDGSQGLSVGRIYIYVHNDLRSLEQGIYQPELSLLRFEAASTPMSMLFVDSICVRERFCQFLAGFHGVCGVLNMEDYGRLIWLNGKAMDEDLPDPWLSPAEIVEHLRQRSRGASQSL